MLRMSVQRTREFVSRVSSCLRLDFPLVVQLAAWRICLPVLKRAFSLATLAEWMWSQPATTLAIGGRQRRIALVTHVMASAGRLFVSPNCLERSLVLYRLLSRAGADPTLVLGAEREGSTVSGHAWVELDGQRLGEAIGDKYTVVVRFGPHGHVGRALEFQSPTT